MKYRIDRLGQRHPWSKGVRRRHCYWEFNGDGRWPERIKGFWKVYWKRTGATMWQSDQHLAYEEFLPHYLADEIPRFKSLDKGPLILCCSAKGELIPYKYGTRI